MTWTEIASYGAATWFALAGLYCLLRYFRERNWLSDDDTTPYSADEQVRARQVWREDRRSLSEPAAKGINREHVHRMPPRDAA